MNAKASVNPEHLRNELWAHSLAWKERPIKFDAVDLTLSGALNLPSLELACPVSFSNCDLSPGIFAPSTKLRTITFSKCTIGRTVLDGAQVDGDLVFEDCIFTSELQLNHARIAGEIILRTCTTAGDIDPMLTGRSLAIVGNFRLSNARVGRVDLQGARVDGSVVFQWSTIQCANRVAFSLMGGTVLGDIDLSNQFVCDGQLNLANATIRGVLNLEGARLSAPCSPNSPSPSSESDACCIYGDGVNIGGDTFLSVGFSADGEVRFLGATFGGDLTLSGATIKSTGDGLSLHSAKVRTNVFLNERFTCTGSIRFHNAALGGIVRIVEADLLGQPALDFEYTSIAGELHLSKSRVEGRIKLERSELGTLRLGALTGKCTISLRQTRCKVLQDTVAAWRSYERYDIVGFRYDTFATEPGWTLKECLYWQARAQGGRFAPQPYEQLAAVQRQMGLAEDAREVLIARQTRIRSTWPAWSVPRRFFHWLYGLTVSYGYRPSKALLFAVGLWLLGFVTIDWAADASGFVPTKLREPAAMYQPTVMKIYPELHPAIYSLEAMVPFLHLHQEEYWLPAHSRIGRFAQRYLWIHTLAGWILGTFLVASVSGLVRKE